MDKKLDNNTLNQINTFLLRVWFKRIKYIFIVVVCLFWNSSILYAKFDPRFQWHYIKTEHFKVYYHTEIKHRLPEYIKVAEETYTRLCHRFKTKPTFRTTLVLVDSTDTVNGFATPIPWNTSSIYTVYPQTESYFKFKNWVETIITHEFTHILNFETSHGYTTLVRSLTGRSVFGFPHIFQPIWITEGFATHTESLDGFGRNNSIRMNMVMRADLLGSFDVSHHNASFFFRRWPSGIVPYNYGARFISFLEEKYGDNKFQDIIHEQADNWIIPVLHDKNAKDVFNTTYSKLWKEWKDKEREKANILKQEIEAQGITPYTLLTSTGFDNSIPIFNRVGNKVYYIRANNFEYPKIMEIPLSYSDNKQGKHSPKEREIVRVGQVSSGSIAITTNHEIYYTQPLPYRNYNSYYDVQVYKPNSFFTKITNRAQRVTKGERISYLDILKDGSKSIFIKLEASNLYSLILSNSTFTKKTVLIDKVKLVLSACKFSNDGSKISFIFQGQENATKTGIAIYHLKTNTISILIEDAYTNLRPTWLPSDEGLIFSSDRTGIYNLYTLSFKDKVITRITNVFGGLFQPDISPDGKWIVATAYSEKGYDVALIPFPAKKYESMPYGIIKEVSIQESIFNTVDIKNETKKVDTIYKSKWANPFPYLLPSSWEPLLSAAYTLQKVGYQLQLTGRDYLDKHSYTFSFYHSIIERQLGVSFAYTYKGLWPDFTFSYSNEDITYGSKYVYAPKLSQKVGFSILIPLLSGATVTHNISTSYQYIYSNFYATYLLPSFLNYSLQKHQSRLSLQYTYHDFSQYAKSISPENGRSLAIAVSSHGSYNYKDYSLLYSVSYNEYLPGFAKNNVIKLGVKVEYVHTLNHAYDFLSLSLARGFRNILYSTYGTRSAIATIQYSLPLWQPDAGNYNTGVAVHDFYTNIYFDYGYLWTQNTLPIAQFNKIVGIEFVWNFSIVYGGVPFQVLTGYAYNIDDSKFIKVNWGQIYFSLTGAISFVKIQNREAEQQLRGSLFTDRLYNTAY